jgi:hypothetical protein
MIRLLPEWEKSCREAIRLLVEARDASPAQMLEVTDSALRDVVNARDGIIQRLREQPLAAEAPDWRLALDTVNVTLSELASVEFPGILDRQHVDQAIELLEGLLGAHGPA